MNNQDLSLLVQKSMHKQITKQGYSTSEQVLMDLNYLSKEDFENWKKGRVDYLERVCRVNLSKLSFILSQMQKYAKTTNLKESCTYYKKSGKGNIKLRFTKTGNEYMERRYSTRYTSTDISTVKKIINKFEGKKDET